MDHETPVPGAHLPGLWESDLGQVSQISLPTTPQQEQAGQHGDRTLQPLERITHGWVALASCSWQVPDLFTALSLGSVNLSLPHPHPQPFRNCSSIGLVLAGLDFHINTDMQYAFFCVSLLSLSQMIFASSLLFLACY